MDLFSKHWKAVFYISQLQSNEPTFYKKIRFYSFYRKIRNYCLWQTYWSINFNINVQYYPCTCFQKITMIPYMNKCTPETNSLHPPLAKADFWFFNISSLHTTTATFKQVFLLNIFLLHYSPLISSSIFPLFTLKKCSLNSPSKETLTKAIPTLLKLCLYQIRRDHGGGTVSSRCGKPETLSIVALLMLSSNAGRPPTVSHSPSEIQWDIHKKPGPITYSHLP